MSQLVIEGTWEEIERRTSELIGHQLRVTVKREKAAVVENVIPQPAKEPKKLVGYGAFKGMTGGSEAFAREKQTEIDLEEGNF